MEMDFKKDWRYFKKFLMRLKQLKIAISIEEKAKSPHQEKLPKKK